MTTRSTNRKVLRSFQARESLWKLFEAHGADMDCSVDYLINEAMRLYAATHNLFGLVDEASGEMPMDMSQTMAMSPVGPSEIPPPVRPTTPPPVPARPSAPPPVPVPAPAPAAAPESELESELELESEVESVSQTSPGRPQLTLIFQGEKFPISGDQFVIGRGSKSSHLAIKDVNVSRKHAAVIFHNGAYYIKDLGSTNGIEFKDKQVDSKRIDEGDVFSICGHDIHFTYSV